MSKTAATFLVLLLANFTLGFAQTKHALVIGNNEYAEDGKLDPLKNCVIDSRLIKKTLEAVGFEVMSGENLTRGEMDDLLLNFENKLKPGDIAVFYFAGHGIEVDGTNYLLGCNARMKAKSRLGEESIKAETVAAAMLQSGAGSSILLLDCCRDSPDDNEWRNRSGFRKRGLAKISIDGDIVIGFAATPGKSALEPSQEGANSPYASALARWIPSGLDHTAMFQKVRQEVDQLTEGQQRTWESGSLLKPFVFHPAKAVGTGVAAKPAVIVFENGGSSKSEMDSKSDYATEILSKLTGLSDELARSPLDQGALLKLVAMNELIKDDAKLESLKQISDSLLQQALTKRNELMSPGNRGPSSSQADMSGTSASNGRQWRVVYTGSDGVNMRDTPGGQLFATTYDQSASPFTQAGGDSSRTRSGIPWVQGTMEGWMAIRKDTRSFDYSRSIGNGVYEVTWNGGGKSSEAFISLRSSHSTSATQLAKVWKGAPFQMLTGDRISSGGYQWVEVRIGGWMAARSPKGTTLLREW